VDCVEIYVQEMHEVNKQLQTKKDWGYLIIHVIFRGPTRKRVGRGETAKVDNIAIIQ
jgi:hypothetical protein